jgi:hypothetical protein
MRRLLSLLTITALAVCGAKNSRAQSTYEPYAISTLAGSVGSSGSADGVGNGAQFSTPFGVAVDSAGNVYIADRNNSTIRMITSSGVVSTLAGSAGVVGSADGTGSTARFYLPAGVAVDGTGNVCIADTYNQTIRKITPGGAVTTLAGLAGARGSADGIGSTARFNAPNGVAMDTTATFMLLIRLTVPFVSAHPFYPRWLALISRRRASMSPIATSP